MPLSPIQVKLNSSFETWDMGNEADVPSMEVTPPYPGYTVETGESFAKRKIIAGKCTSRVPVIENPSSRDQVPWSAESSRRDDKETACVF